MLQLGYIRLLNGWIRQRAFSDIRKQKLFMPKEIWVMPKTGVGREILPYSSIVMMFLSSFIGM